MKKYFLFITILLFVKTHSCFSQTADTTLTYLSHLNLDIYKNKPVDSFLNQIPTGYMKMRIASPGNPKVAQVLSILYSNNVYIWVYVYKFKFMNPRSETMTWDINLFRKEDIDHIVVWKSVDCYNGCQ